MHPSEDFEWIVTSKIYIRMCMDQKFELIQEMETRLRALTYKEIVHTLIAYKF